MTTVNVSPVEATTGFPARRLAWGVVAAVALNLVIFGIGSSAGATWIANGQTVAWFLVIVATVVAMAVGGAITYALSRRWSSARMVMSWVGLAFAVVTAPSPFMASDDSATRWALASMHVITGIVWFVTVRPRRVESAD